MRTRPARDEENCGLPESALRRRLVGALGLLGGGALLGGDAVSGVEPPPEVGRIRIQTDPIICIAPQFLAEPLLRLEGFEHVEYVDLRGGLGPRALGQDTIDITLWDAASSLTAFERHKGFAFLAGLHAGCWELFGNHQVKVIRDLVGKRIAVRGFGDTDHVLISSMLAYVGIDPRTAVRWVKVATYRESMELFAAGKVDALLASPPRPQELRARGIGQVIVNSTRDRPWAHYYCCMIEASRTFIERNPVATKRALRAILKAADLCADAPERAARMLVERGDAKDYAIALEVLRSLPFRDWRDVHPEDTLRFFALRLYEAGMIRTSPNALIAESADWRFLADVRRELKS